uniref:Protein Jade-1 n=1 Tax=Trichobilharzia regenti TaxID=157069 RepID=A0AA85KFS0_TRIRE|nr:unnamed protein product [Trichobilharzia regenti]
MERCKEVKKILSQWEPMSPDNNDGEPAEVFDRHPLSAMMINADGECGNRDDLVMILNTWKSEWHREGVQVPVKDPSSLPKPIFKKLDTSRTKRRSSRFVMPDKLRVELVDGNFDDTIHCVVDKKIKKASYYHIDDLDQAWISTLNEERQCLGQTPIKEWMLEKVITTLEYLTYVKMREKIKEIDMQCLEFDENARCDICQSYEGEDGNELVFCDGCFLCVHQACYGILQIPEGSWMCRQCEAGVKSTTPCCLCPNTGGAMKLSEDGQRWCHVSCALWIPEVGFGNVELMEPVIRLDSIPQARRNLLCSICRSRYGAPVQCSNPKCKIAFHVTCAFQSNLVMRQELVEKDVRLVALCRKHSRKEQLSSTHHSSGMCELFSPGKTLDAHQNFGNSMQPVAITRQQRLIDLEYNFQKLVDESELNMCLDNSSIKSQFKYSAILNANEQKSVPKDIRTSIFAYWRLKRRSKYNQPLIYPIPVTWKESADEIAASTKEELARVEQANADMKAFESFKRIRIGLDKTRMIVDLTLQRERRKEALLKRMSRISTLQLSILEAHNNLVPSELLKNVHMGESIYDNWELFSAYSRSFMQRTNDTKHHSSSHETKRTLRTLPVDLDAGEKPDTLETPKCHTPSETRQNTDSLSINVIPKECLVVPDNIKQRLRSALSLVTNSFNMWVTSDRYADDGGDHKSETNNQHKIKSDKSFPANRTKYCSSKTHTSSPSSPKLNMLMENELPIVQVKLSPIPDGTAFKYYGNSVTSSDECTPIKKRKQSNNSNSSFLDKSPNERIPVLTKFAMITLSPGATKFL